MNVRRSTTLDPARGPAGALVLLLSAALGCDQGRAPAPPTERLRPEVTKVSLQDMPEGHPDPGALAVLSRGPRRMSVEQLERSIDAIGQLAPGTVKLDQNLAFALGRPDYLRLTEEALDPTPLFMKFMMDLGGYSCKALADADPMRPIEQRALMRFDDPDENLRYLILRFTGIEGEAADELVRRLEPVRSAGARGPRGELGGWEAVCLALFTSPEFLLY